MSARSRSRPLKIELPRAIQFALLSLELQGQGGFPMSVPITGHTVGWVEQEIQAWLTGKLAERRPSPAVAVRNTRWPG